jgi:hypothetical protein
MYLLITGSVCPNITYSLLGPNTSVSTLFSNTLMFVRNKVSYPYSAIGNVIVLYGIIFMFLDIKR